MRTIEIQFRRRIISANVSWYPDAGIRGVVFQFIIRNHLSPARRRHIIYGPRAGYTSASPVSTASGAIKSAARIRTEIRLSRGADHIVATPNFAPIVTAPGSLPTWLRKIGDTARTPGHRRRLCTIEIYNYRKIPSRVSRILCVHMYSSTDSGLSRPEV